MDDLESFALDGELYPAPLMTIGGTYEVLYHDEDSGVLGTGDENGISMGIFNAGTVCENVRVGTDLYTFEIDGKKYACKKRPELFAEYDEKDPNGQRQQIMGLHLRMKQFLEAKNRLENIKAQFKYVK